MKKTSPTAGKPDAVAAKAAARSTASRPSHPSPSTGGDALADQAAATEAVVASIPFNANKPGEYGRDNATMPLEGVHVDVPSEVGASTLTETNRSAKTGRGATPGANATVDSLDRVRADAGGQVLTTNQGVAIADN